MKEIKDQISSIIKERHRVNLDIFNTDFIERIILQRQIENKFTSIRSYYNFICINENEGEILINSLNVGYSEFFRNPLTFSFLEKVIIPELIVKKKSTNKEIRIWSAACSFGQEAYSLAILMEEAKNLNHSEIEYRIFATDISPSFIKMAKTGAYTSGEIKNFTLRRKEEWLTEKREKFYIAPSLKSNISFSVFNLLDNNLLCPSESIFGSFDLIFCSNIFFYYQQIEQTIILDKLKRCIDCNSYIVTGEVERQLFLDQGFKEVFPFSSVFQKHSPLHFDSNEVSCQ